MQNNNERRSTGYQHCLGVIDVSIIASLFAGVGLVNCRCLAVEFVLFCVLQADGAGQRILETLKPGEGRILQKKITRQCSSISAHCVYSIINAINALTARQQSGIQG